MQLLALNHLRLIELGGVLEPGVWNSTQACASDLHLDTISLISPFEKIWAGSSSWRRCFGRSVQKGYVIRCFDLIRFYSDWLSAIWKCNSSNRLCFGKFQVRCQFGANFLDILRFDEHSIPFWNLKSLRLLLCPPDDDHWFSPNPYYSYQFQLIIYSLWQD